MEQPKSNEMSNGPYYGLEDRLEPDAATLMQYATNLSYQKKAEGKVLSLSTVFIAAIEWGAGKNTKEKHAPNALRHLSQYVLNNAGDRYAGIRRSFFKLDPPRLDELETSIKDSSFVGKIEPSTSLWTVLDALGESDRSMVSVIDLVSTILEYVREPSSGGLLRGRIDELGLDIEALLKTLSSVDHRVNLQSDRPESMHDPLGRGPLALVLARMVNRIWNQKNLEASGNQSGSDKGDEPAFILLVDAPWGGGKTTFANYLTRILNPGYFGIKREHFANDSSERFGHNHLFSRLPMQESRIWPYWNHKWITVNFNAWQNEHIVPPWWNFYESVHGDCLRVLRREDWLKWVRLTLSEWLWRLWTAEVQIVLVAVLVGWSAAFAAANWWSVEDSSANALIVAAFGGTTLLAIIKGFQAGIKRIAASMSSPENPERLGSPDPLRKLRNHFSEFLTHVREPVIVVIDDIDRCRPEHVVELLRGLLTVFRSPRIVYLILGDRRWIETAFEHVYTEMVGAHADDNVSFGGRFAEKALQISFLLPDPDESGRSVYLKTLLGDDANLGKAVDSAQTQDILSEAVHLYSGASSEQEITKGAEEIQDRLKQVGAENDHMAQRRLHELAAMRASGREDVERGIQHALLDVIELLPDNPRRIKRIINMIALYQESARIEHGVVPGSSKWRQLVLWVILMSEQTARWAALCADPSLAAESRGVSDDDSATLKVQDGRENADGRSAMIDGEPVELDVTAVTWLRRLTPERSSHLTQTQKQYAPVVGVENREQEPLR